MSGRTVMVALRESGDQGIVNREKRDAPNTWRPISGSCWRIGCEVVEFFDDAVRVVGKTRQRHTNINTLPYPGFPSDMQPQWQ